MLVNHLIHILSRMQDDDGLVLMVKNLILILRMMYAAVDLDMSKTALFCSFGGYVFVKLGF